MVIIPPPCPSALYLLHVQSQAEHCGAAGLTVPCPGAPGCPVDGLAVPALARPGSGGCWQPAPGGCLPVSPATSCAHPALVSGQSCAVCRTCLALVPTHSLCWGLSWLEGMRGQPWSLPVRGCVPEPQGFQLPGPAGATSALLPVGTLGAVPGGSPCPVKGLGAALLLPNRRWAAWPRSWQSPAQAGRCQTGLFCLPGGGREGGR